MGKTRVIVAAIAAWLVGHSVVAQRPAEVAYSFRQGDGPGGIAVARVDTKSGKILGQTIVFERQSCNRPKKLRYVAGERLFVLSNESKAGPHVFLIQTQAGRQADVTDLTLGLDQPDELRVAGGFALVTADDDFIYKIDLERKAVIAVLDPANLFDPDANAPQDIFILPDMKHAVISFQKDSQTGRKKGNRLAIFSYPDLALVADIQLKRDHPKLHIAGNKKEQGPGPEIVHVSPSTNTLLTTLDLYGAVAVMDWDAARSGRNPNCKYLSTSRDDRWGISFPDRALPLPDGRHVLVSNAGAEGGVVWVDLKRRAIVGKASVPHGLDTPVYIAGLEKAYAACPGKIKVKNGQKGVVTKEYEPQAALYVLDLKAATARAVATDPHRTFALAPVAIDSDILIAAVGDKTATKLLTFDVRHERVMDVQPVKGTIEQFAHD